MDRHVEMGILSLLAIDSFPPGWADFAAVSGNIIE